jgi:hypothetical protein
LFIGIPSTLLRALSLSKGSPTKKIGLLRVLWNSAVNANNFVLFLITPCQSDEEPLLLRSGRNEYKRAVGGEVAKRENG